MPIKQSANKAYALEITVVYMGKFDHLPSMNCIYILCYTYLQIKFLKILNIIIYYLEPELNVLKTYIICTHLIRNIIHT